MGKYPVFLIPFFAGLTQHFPNRETHHSGPEILSAKTGHELPVMDIASPEPEVFAAYTAPDGGLTSICKIEDHLSTSMQEADHSEDFDYIDLDEGPPSVRKRNSSETNIPSALESNISKDTFSREMIY